MNALANGIGMQQNQGLQDVIYGDCKKADLLEIIKKQNEKIKEITDSTKSTELIFNGILARMTSMEEGLKASDHKIAVLQGKNDKLEQLCGFVTGTSAAMFSYIYWPYTAISAVVGSPVIGLCVGFGTSKGLKIITAQKSDASKMNVLSRV